MLSAPPLLAHALRDALATGGEAMSVSQDALMPTIAAAMALLFCSAFFSGSETALFSLQPLDRQKLNEAGATTVDALLRTPRRTLATLLIGNELVNVTLSSVTAGIVFAMAPDRPWLNVVVLTPVLLLLGEVTPKVVALRLNRRWATLAAPPLRLFSTVVSPVRWMLTSIANIALRMTGGSTAPAEQALREEQLRQLIDQGRAAGNLAPLEQEMMLKVFDFGDLTVNRLMTPRPDIVSISLTAPWASLLSTLRNTGHSRIPIWKGRPDNIVGILVAKSLLPVLDRVLAGHAPPEPSALQALLVRPRFVPTSKRAEDMLREFRTERFHMSVVVDEHGSVVGIVTLDDLLAELVGELLDETDEDDPEVVELGADLFTVRATMDVEDFAERFRVELPDGDYNTLGGFILDQVGEVPDKGAEVTYGGLRFVVTGVDARRVVAVSVGPSPVATVAEPEASR